MSYLTGIPLIHYFPEHIQLLSFFTSLLTLDLMRRSFLVGVENNNHFDSTDDKMEERDDQDDSSCI